jgi:hypothetical protein
MNEQEDTSSSVQIYSWTWEATRLRTFRLFRDKFRDVLYHTDCFFTSWADPFFRKGESVLLVVCQQVHIRKSERPGIPFPCLADGQRTNT